MTTIRSGFSTPTFMAQVGAAAPVVSERRSVPRMAPFAPEMRSGSGVVVRDSCLDELKARPRRPGQAGFFFFDHHFQHNAVKVLPGEYFASNESMVIMTVLGSCIAACLWDSRMQVGGMNHFMLPDSGGNGQDSGRYGSYAMELLINEMLKLGARRETLRGLTMM